MMLLLKYNEENKAETSIWLYEYRLGVFVYLCCGTLPQVLLTSRCLSKNCIFCSWARKNYRHVVRFNLERLMDTLYLLNSVYFVHFQ